MIKWLKTCRFLLIAALVGLIITGGLYLERLTRMDPDALDLRPGPLILDRQGRVLYLGTAPGGSRLVKLPPGPLPKLVAAAFIAAEDQRFRSHPGVDPLAVIRAAFSNLKAGRVVSGASTITQQLARLTFPGSRTWSRKLAEMGRSLRMEAALSKDEILRRYLNRVPQGNNLTGVQTAALAYFGKPAAKLTSGEAALLASLAKAPGRLNPLGPNRRRLLTRRNWVLGRMAKLGFISEPERQRSRQEPLFLAGVAGNQGRFPFKAQHLVNLILAAKGQETGMVRTTLNLTWQRQLEQILRSHAGRLKAGGARQAAAVILDNRGPEVLALAGSLHYGPQDGGYNNGATAWRSPGSALKPFLYALALDRGFTAASVLEDVERRYRLPGGEFHPANFDRVAHGPISFREALGNSLNLAAVRLLNLVGPEQYYETLSRLGLINRPDKGPEFYGLGLVVGNPEVSLLELAAAYACLANQGMYRSPRLLLDQPLAEEVSIFSEQAAFIVSDILADPLARSRAFGGSQAMNPPYRLALKTGTSTRYRDCWAVAYSPRYTLAVWVGNFDGRPTATQSGATAAAPILAEIAGALFAAAPPEPFLPPEGVTRARVCSFSGMRPGPGCHFTVEEYFVAGTEPVKECTYHQERSPWHRLDTAYAGWLQERHEHGAAGRYRLAGFDPNLDRTLGRGLAGASFPPASRGGGGSYPGSAALREGGRVSILYPLPGDRFLLAPQREEVEITLKARCRAAVRQVSWFVNGREVGAVGPPYQIQAPLPRGRHRLTALGPDGLGDTVEVSVQ
ncbi:MAG: penicillin-binding protein 1C [Thermodesulfobacteriota bacterium]